MSLSKYTKRFQITLNESKEKDRVILDYLDKSYNANDKIKELLYLAVMNQYNEKLLTITNNDEKKVIERGVESKEKLLTISNDKQQKVKQNELDQLKEFM